MNKKTCIFVLLMLLLVAEGYSQCAMCRTSAESDMRSGGSIATGLNTGILYLMAIPYLILMTGAYFFFRKQVDSKLRSWKQRFFS